MIFSKYEEYVNSLSDTARELCQSTFLYLKKKHTAWSLAECRGKAYEYMLGMCELAKEEEESIKEEILKYRNINIVDILDKISDDSHGFN